MDYLTIAMMLFALGIIMLIAEVLLPTGGILIVASLLFFALGIGMILARGTITEAIVAMGVVAIGMPAVGYVAVAAYQRMSIGGELESSAAPLEIAGLAELESLRNRTGKTVSPMRPSGTVEFDGKRIDAMAEGVMIDAGVWVRCVSVKGSMVLVREMEPPTDISDISVDSAIASDKREPVPNITLDITPTSPASPPPTPKEPIDDFDLDIGLDK